MIEVQNVFFTYPNGINALKNVNLKIKNGEFIAIMGQNGAGKTTLVKHFNGLLKPTKGKVLINNFDTQKVSVARLSRTVGFVFQNPDHQLFCETVEKEIAFALNNFGYSEQLINERVNWALEFLDLQKYSNTSPFMLSGGERKRVALASVLAWDPEIIILDEPTIGQDNRQKERLHNLIVSLNKENKTVVIVSHDIEFIADCNPKIVLMAGGNIISRGTAKDILTQKHIIEKASLILPEIAQIFIDLEDLGFKSNIINIYKAADILTKKFGEHR